MKTGQFFFIRNTEGLRIREVSKLFMNATRERLPVFGFEALALLLGVLGGPAIITGATLLISAPQTTVLPLPVTIGALVFGVAGVIGALLIMRWTGRIIETRREISGGAHRPFIVTTKHYSYSTLLSLEVRALVAKVDAWPVLRDFFVSQEIIDADENILQGDGVVSTAESKFLVIDRAKAVMLKLGLDPGDRLSMLHDALVRQLEATANESQEVVAAAQQLIARYAA